METKKKWVEPQIEEVELESEEEVLATCYTASMSSRTGSWTYSCRNRRCATYP